MASDHTPPTPWTNPADPHEALRALRARAEQRRYLVTQAAEQHTPDDVRRLLQELQVHQIELEMQYEELLLAQADAQAARAEYHNLYDFAPIGYFALSQGGTVEQLNLCASQQLGAVRQRLLGRRFALFVAPAERLAFGQFLAKVFANDSTQSAEFALQREDGSTFYAQLEGLRAQRAEELQCRLAVLDVTARRAATQQLAASEARFRKLFADSNDAVVLLQGHQFVDCNAAALRLLGAHAKEQLVGRPAWAHAPEHQPGGQRTIDLFRETTEAAIRTGSQRCEALMTRVTGEEIWVEAVLTPIELGGLQPLVHILWRDVTAARAAREELRLSQERLQMALAAAESGVWVWELAGHQLHWDARAQAIFGLGYDPGPVSFEVLRGAVHPQDLIEMAVGLKRSLAEHRPFDLEYRIVWPDGTVRYVAALGKVVHDERGHPLRLIGIMHDVTPRREAENALRREKDFTESLLDNSVDGILALDRHARITAWNAEAARYFGLEAAAVLGRPLFDVLPSLSETACLDVSRALAGERVTCLAQPLLVRPGHFDAYLVPLKANGEAEPSGVLAIIRDVTERDRLAEEATQLRLRQQQEVLAAILATQETERKRIAEALHNGLGQLLYAAKLSLENRAARPAAPDASLKLLDDAIRAARTISFELTPGVLEDFGLHTALEALVKRMGPTGLPVRLHLLGLEQRLAAPVEIAVYRVVQELLNNVMKHANATEAVVHVVREGHRLEVSVEDNGHGFAPSTLASQPLAGIGLSGVRNRVALLGGELSIQSRLGQGTIVSFELNV
ncbi:PAS domain-containing sensor histidine kinase [Hymenobacter armeniacus]|uniref:histidine kinase n=1 Tax=Hymenobacter armeniacus TaxID=2771358 RepID=A0ABR8JRU6_9BACT|nr:PAS domain S-box protein [Hymenobacter armeniacus]MBD2722037.1 PAS domain S-box protein [Hymenobacter armeniacus]